MVYRFRICRFTDWLTSTCKPKINTRVTSEVTHKPAPRGEDPRLSHTFPEVVNSSDWKPGPFHGDLLPWFSHFVGFSFMVLLLKKGSLSAVQKYHPVALNMRASRSKPPCEMNMTSAAWGLCSVLINQRYVFYTVSLNRAHITEGLCWLVNEKVVTRGSQGNKAGFLPGAVVECSLIQYWRDFTEHTTANDRSWP